MKKETLLVLVIIMICVVASVSFILILRSRKADEQLAKLVGQWIRPDGGYILDIREVLPGGEVDAAYYNPRQINVSEARLSSKEKMPYLFIELRDKGYPGATYDLVYVEDQDALVGVYYQPSVDQRFEVIFVRSE